MDHRFSRLESFLKRALPGRVFADIRYYEGCMVRVGKEDLCFKYAVVTGKSLLLADHPPRDVREAARLSDVTSIRVENSCHEFPRATCQHIRVGYCQTPPPRVGPRQDLDTPAVGCHAPGADDRKTRISSDIRTLLQRVGTARPHIPRSRSSLAQSSSVPEPRRAHSSLEKPRPRRSHDVEVARQSGSVRETDIRLYIIQVGSALLNHLQCSWSTELLSSTLELAGSRRVGKTGDRSIETEYRRYKRQLLGPLDDAGHSPALLQNLQRHPDLKKAFWKDRTLFHFLTQRLRPLLLDPADTPETVDQRRVLTARIEELELAALLLDILLATLQDSNCISDKIQMLQFDGGSALQELLALLVTPPSIPHAYRNACSRMLEDFHEFGSSGRSNLPEAELIRSLAEVTNVSTAILYELLLTLRNNSAIKLSKLLEGLNLECHLKRSVTQLLGLLFPSQPQKLKPLEAVLVYQHFFVLHSLMESITRVRYYVREQFEEEFRYYAHWSRVGSKLPDSYPIKRLFQRLVEGVHRMASGGCKDKSAPSLFS